MFDAALIQQCAAPNIQIAIVERFIAAVGSDDPLKVTITMGNRVILPEAPRNPDQALRLIQQFVPQATVRVGVTQYPAGYGVSDPTRISPTIVDACENIRMGTALFGKVYRIVAHAHATTGGSTFSEAMAAWRTGLFHGQYVFGELDPGPLSESGGQVGGDGVPLEAELPDPEVTLKHNAGVQIVDPNRADIRVDLSGILDTGANGGQALNPPSIMMRPPSPAE